MGSAAKENSCEYAAGLSSLAAAKANQNATKPAGKTESIGTRRALAPKPANLQQRSINSPHNVTKKRHADFSANFDGQALGTSARPVGADDLPQSGTKRSRLQIMEKESSTDTTEDESEDAGHLTPLANLAARRSQSRSKVLYPRSRVPLDLSAIEPDFVSATKEPSFNDQTRAFFDSLAAYHRSPPLASEITMDSLPDLEVDISSEEEVSITELKTPTH